MGAPVGGIHPSAVIGEPGEHRGHLARHVRYGVPAHLRPVIAPSARVSAHVRVDSGTFRATEVGARAFLMAGAHVGHDCLVGADVEISCNAALGGEVVVEDGAKLGLGCVVLPGRKVGRGAIVGAGAVVTRDVPAHEIWAGNPARKFRDVDAGYRYGEPDAWPDPSCGVDAAAGPRRVEAGFEFKVVA